MEYINITDYYIFLFSILLITGVLANKFSDRIGVPALVLFIGVGMILGSDFLNMFFLDDPKVVQIFGTLALIIILFEGGFNTDYQVIRPILGPASMLATLGVIITSLSIGLFATYVLQVPLLEGLLFGAIVGSTDAAAVFGILGQRNIKSNIKATLEAESGLNDPMAIFLTITLITTISIGNLSITSLLGTLLWQIALGLIMGWTLGKASIYLVNNINLISSGLYPIFALSLAICTYGVTAQLKGSGFLAVYIFALVLGNTDLAYRNSIAKFHEGFALMMQILMFITLGLLVFPKQLPEVILGGLLLSFFLIFVARPLGVFISTSFFKFSLKERLFMSWTGLRGAVPIILATYLLVGDINNSDFFFNSVFFVVFTSALIQGLTINTLANKLGLIDDTEIAPSYNLELTSIGKANADIIEITIRSKCKVINEKIEDLNLPNDCLINAIVRENNLLAPRGNTIILNGDTLFILCHLNKVKQVKKVFYD